MRLAGRASRNGGYLTPKSGAVKDTLAPIEHARRESPARLCGDAEKRAVGYDTRLMKMTRSRLVVGLLAAQAALLGFGAATHSPMMDEIAHLAAGISHWELATYDLYKVNPPFIRMLAALPAMAAGAKADYGDYSPGEATRAEFRVMDDFVRANGRRVLWLVTLARWALIPLALLGGYVCYRWARELYGDMAGMIALLLWCFCPNVLAYAQALTADLGAAALGVTAAYVFWKWLRDPAWDRAVFAGIVLGLAQLTKTTWGVLFGLWPLVWFAWRICPLRWETARRAGRTHRGPRPTGDRDGPKSEKQSGTPDEGPGLSVEGSGETGMTHRPRQRENPWRGRGARARELAQFAAVLILPVFCINAGYEFDGTGTRLRDYTFLSRPLVGAAAGKSRPPFGNRFAKSWLGNLPVPLPKNYVEGIDWQWHDIELGKPSYLRGRWKQRGWWYWYLYALAVKVPLGTWGLLLLAVGLRARRWRRRRSGGIAERDGVTWRDELLLLAPATVVLALVSSQTGFSRYIRYVLPIFPFMFIWISGLAPRLGTRRFALAFHRREATFAAPDVPSTKEKEDGSAAMQSETESPRSKCACIAAGLLLAWSISSSLWYAPHWMSYFNEIAGGPMGGPAHLIDAQVDWGQDLLYLKKWLDSDSGARPLGLVYFGPINPSIAGIEFSIPPKGAALRDSESNAQVAKIPAELKPGWYAVSVNFLYGYPHRVYSPQDVPEWVSKPSYSYFRHFEPMATSGYSIYIYHLTADQIAVAIRE